MDIPELHFSQNRNGRDNVNKIFDVLYDFKNNDVFESESIKTLIEVRWARLKPRIIIFELLPYIVYMAVFYVYTIYDL
jgi:hypothetical protein